MSLCLKHRVIRVMKIIKRVKYPIDCFRVIRRLLKINLNIVYMLLLILRRRNKHKYTHKKNI